MSGLLPRSMGQFSSSRFSKGMLSIIGVAILVAVAIYLTTPNDRDRWVNADGTVACKRKSDAQIVSGISDAASRKSLTADFVRRRVCSLLYAGHRVRLLTINDDGALGEVLLREGRQRQWVEIRRLSTRSFYRLTLPWFPTIHDTYRREVADILSKTNTTGGPSRSGFLEWATGVFSSLFEVKTAAEVVVAEPRAMTSDGQPAWVSYGPGFAPLPEARSVPAADDSIMPSQRPGYKPPPGFSLIVTPDELHSAAKSWTAQSLIKDETVAVDSGVMATAGRVPLDPVSGKDVPIAKPVDAATGRLGDGVNASGEPEETEQWTSVSVRPWLRISLPANWQIHGPGFSKWVGNLMESKGVSGQVASESFMAQSGRSPGGDVQASMNVRFYPDMVLSQKDVASFSASEIADLDAGLREGLQEGVKKLTSVLDWKGTRVETINGFRVFLTEYIRGPVPNDKPEAKRSVRLYRVLDGRRSFAVTVSYDLSVPIYRHITDRIARSARIGEPK